MEKLENIMEALLFLSGNSIDIRDIASKLNIKEKEVREAAEALRAKYGGSAGIHILRFNNKLQFSSNPDYAPIVDSVLNPIKERELSKAMMEVSSIVAYKQPVTRMEIEEIRGVNSDYVLSVLAKHNIIEVVGRKDAIGKPLLYGTTDDFLKRFQLSSLDELPDYEDILDRIKILHKDDSSDLYYREQYQQQNGEQTEQNENGEITETTDTADNTPPPPQQNEEYEDEIPDFLKEEKNLKVFK
jgi:segregation and condensation protein B